MNPFKVGDKVKGKIKGHPLNGILTVTEVHDNFLNLKRERDGETTGGWSYERFELVEKSKDCDPINSPSHYTSSPSGVECIVIAEHMTFCIGNAIKYIWRAGLKDKSTEIEDLKKARWYIDREISRLESAK